MPVRTLIHGSVLERLARRCALPGALLAGALASLAAADQPQWIWDGPARNDQHVSFRRAFTLPAAAAKVRLIATCDNVVTVFVNGTEVLHGEAWTEPGSVDVSKQLVAGANVIAVEAVNQDSAAGLVLELTGTLAGGAPFTLVSDAAWKASEKPAEGWKKAGFADADWTASSVLGALGAADLPWSGQVDAARFANAAKPAGLGLTLPPGFVAERLERSDKTNHHSWISIAPDRHGSFILADEKDGLWRLTVPPAGAGGDADAAGEASLERLEGLPFKGAHGLLRTPDSLYVMASPHDHGLHRVAASAGGWAQTAQKLVDINGTGEHGCHSVITAPDGRSLYYICGNMTPMPPFARSLIPKNWDEDLLIPRLWDPRGFMVGAKAPGGFIMHTDLDGKDAEVVAMGFRNPFDLAFDPRGELFTYDADMEWDMGSPWYRPTRICQVVSGAEFGWRSGSAKWSPAYEDSVPPVVDVGPGSPTGVVFGTGTRFPPRWQHALFALDWTYGTISAVFMKPAGAGFTGELEDFCAGPGFAVTDAVVGDDGALYVTAGGRGGNGEVFRIRYTGEESTAPKPLEDDQASIAARALRHKLEAFHGHTDAQAVATAWAELGNPDRLIRYAARIAIENNPVAEWQARALAERSPQAAVIALLALARQGAADQLPALLDAFARLDLAALPEGQQINALRVLAVAFGRMGHPDEAHRASLAARLDPLLPTGRAAVDVELVGALAVLDSPNVIPKTMALIAALPPTPVPDWTSRIARNAGYGGGVAAMLKDMPPQQGIRYAYALRTVTHGWTLDQRRAYFTFVAAASRHPGGASFEGYIAHLRKEALDTCSPDERTALAAITGEKLGAPSPIAAILPQGPGQAWTVATATAALAKEGGKADAVRGRGLFQGIGCGACHRFAGSGGDVGPDLTSVGNKFNAEALLTAAIEPSKDISDQYAAMTVILDDGQVLSGRVSHEGDGAAAVVKVYPYIPGAEPTRVPKAKVKSITLSKISPMPPGLVNSLSAGELRDLVAFVLSRGDVK
jgi:putative heme-binding domain-containing protein